VPLGRPFDAVDRVKAGVKPLGAVGRRYLMREHIAGFIVKSFFIVLIAEVVILSPPVHPGIGQPVKNLAGVVLGPVRGQILAGIPGIDIPGIFASLAQAPFFPFIGFFRRDSGGNIFAL